MQGRVGKHLPLERLSVRRRGRVRIFLRKEVPGTGELVQPQVEQVPRTLFGVELREEIPHGDVQQGMSVTEIAQVDPKVLTFGGADDVAHLQVAVHAGRGGGDAVHEAQNGRFFFIGQLPAEQDRLPVCEDAVAEQGGIAGGFVQMAAHPGEAAADFLQPLRFLRDDAGEGALPGNALEIQRRPVPVGIKGPDQRGGQAEAQYGARHRLLPGDRLL